MAPTGDFTNYLFTRVTNRLYTVNTPYTPLYSTDTEVPLTVQRIEEASRVRNISEYEHEVKRLREMMKSEAEQEDKLSLLLEYKQLIGHMEGIKSDLYQERRVQGPSKESIERKENTRLNELLGLDV